MSWIAPRVSHGCRETIRVSIADERLDYEDRECHETGQSRPLTGVQAVNDCGPLQQQGATARHASL
jgi:hypothetical protein